MNILLVEDEAIPAMDLKRRLEGFGYTVVGHALTGNGAIESARTLKPDLVLMDIKLKGEMDGIEAAGIIQESGSVPIVFLTAFSDRDTLKRSMSIAPHGYVLKPVNDRDLFATLEAAQVRSALERDLRRRLDLEYMFTRIASLAAAADSLETFLLESSPVIGETMAVSRVYFLAVDADTSVFDNTHEWCADGVSSGGDIVDGKPAREGGYFFDQLTLGRTLAIADIGEIEDDATRNLLERQNIQALLLFPVILDNELYGIVGFDECRQKRIWQPDELKALETMVDLLKGLILRFRIEKKLQQQLYSEKMIGDIFSRLIEALPDQMDLVVNDALEMAGRFLQADRAYVSRFEEDGRYYNNTHEWCAEGIEPQMEYLRRVDTHRLSYFYSRLMKNEIFVFEDIEDLPDSAEPEKESYRRQSIQSIIIFPAFIRGKLSGFIGFDSVRKKRSWDGVDRHWLRIFSRVCVLGVLSPYEVEG